MKPIIDPLPEAPGFVVGVIASLIVALGIVLVLSCLGCGSLLHKLATSYTEGPANYRSYVGTADLYSTISAPAHCLASLYVDRQDRSVRFQRLILTGHCDGYEFPIGQSVLMRDTETFTTWGTVADPFCGTLLYRVEGMFQNDGRFLELDYRYDSNMCGADGIHVSLTRVGE